MVEKIYMKKRMMGVQFLIKSMEAKDRYIDANIKNVISELSVDIKNYGIQLVLRKDSDTSIYEFIDNISKMNNNGSYS